MLESKEIINNSRYNNLDKLKAICSFLIIIIHAPITNDIGEYLVSLARIAVPVFFIISGYFFDLSRSKHNINKLIKLFFISSCIYLFWNIILGIISHDFIDRFKDFISIKRIIAFILFNQNPLQSHLWYLGAILYVVILISIILKKNENKRKKILWVLSPILLLLDLIFGKYSLLIFYREFPVVFIRNWIFVGIPFFSIGLWLRDIKFHLAKIYTVLLIVFFACSTILERFLLVSIDKNAVRDQYISTIFLSISVFVFFRDYISNKKNIVSIIGNKFSAWIYIIHPIIIYIFDALFDNYEKYTLIICIRPILVFTISIAITMLFSHFFQWLRSIFGLNSNIKKIE